MYQGQCQKLPGRTPPAWRVQSGTEQPRRRRGLHRATRETGEKRRRPTAGPPPARETFLVRQLATTSRPFVEGAPSRRPLGPPGARRQRPTMRPRSEQRWVPGGHAPRATHEDGRSYSSRVTSRLSEGCFPVFVDGCVLSCAAEGAPSLLHESCTCVSPFVFFPPRRAAYIGGKRGAKNAFAREKKEIRVAHR
jgi:hypothetical protein